MTSVSETAGVRYAEPDGDRELTRLQDSIRARKGILACGREYAVAVTAEGRVRFAGTNKWGQEDAAAWRNMTAVVGGAECILGVTTDGSVRFAGRDTAGLREGLAHLRRVSLPAVSPTHAAALLTGGRVLCVGDGAEACAAVSEWRDIRDICCGRNFTLGLTKDGEVLVAGGDYALREKIAAWGRVAGLFSDDCGEQVYAITATGGLVGTGRIPGRLRRAGHLAFVAASRAGMWGITATGQLCGRHRVTDGTALLTLAAGGGHLLSLDRDGYVHEPEPRLRGAHRADTGWRDIDTWAPLFDGEDGLFIARRHVAADCLDRARTYLTRLTQATRYARRLACGPRLTACIAADGRVLATGGVSLSAGETLSMGMGGGLQLSCGGSHLLALCRGGRVVAAGNDMDGCCRVSDWTNIASVQACDRYSLGLCENGQVRYAGAPHFSIAEVATWEHIRLLRGSETCVIGVTASGELKCAGQHPALRGQTLPAVGWGDLCDLVVSRHILAGLRRDGRVIAFSDLEDMTEVVSDWRGIRALAVGDRHLVGLCVGGDVVSVGRNEYRQCDVSDWQDVVSVACCADCTVGLLADGTVRAAGQLYVGADAIHKDGRMPCRTEGWTHILAVACGQHHVVAMTEGGQLLSCGLDADGQCRGVSMITLFQELCQYDGVSIFSRDNGSEESESAPLVSSEHDDAGDDGQAAATLPIYACGGQGTAESARVIRRTVGCGLAHAVTLFPPRTVHAVGNNEEGQCNTAAWQDCTAVACGPYHTAAVCGGLAVATGRNTAGQCHAAGLNALLAVPAEGQPRTSAAAFAAVACGHDHTAALRGDGRVFSIGCREDGRCDTEAWHDVVDLACGVKHTVAVLSDGHCVAVGDDSHGQCRVQDWENVVMVACGEFHTVGLTADGRLLAAGEAENEACRVGDLRDVLSVACLSDATVCVHANGRVTVRGSNRTAREVSSIRDAVAADGCEFRLAILCADGRMVLLPSLSGEDADK